MNCLFCSIISGSIPSQKVYEDEHTYAFLDINPTNPGHTLVIPKKHCLNIHDADDETLAHCMHTVKIMAQAVKEGMQAQGINILQNNGTQAGQVIFHTHFHVVPRYENDGFHHWPGTPYTDQSEAEAVASKIMNVIKTT